MKKIFFICCTVLFFLSGVLISCHHTVTISTEQSTIDSMVAAKVNPIRQQLQAMCDTAVMQAAQAKADSILHAQKK